MSKIPTYKPKMVKKYSFAAHHWTSDSQHLHTGSIQLMKISGISGLANNKLIWEL